jgi:adenylate kinase
MIKTPLPLVAVMGPPGAGKSTALISMVNSNRSYARFSVRDYGLELFERGDPLGLEIGPLLQQRLQLPDPLVQMQLVRFVNDHRDSHSLVLSESYPRGIRQCQDAVSAAHNLGCPLLGLVSFQIPDALVRRRVRERLTCCSCALPQQGTTPRRCISCLGWAERRSDDQSERFLERLKAYYDGAGEVEDYFNSICRLIRLDATVSEADLLRGLWESVAQLVERLDQ